MYLVSNYRFSYLFYRNAASFLQEHSSDWGKHPFSGLQRSGLFWSSMSYSNWLWCFCCSSWKV